MLSAATAALLSFEPGRADDVGSLQYLMSWGCMLTPSVLSSGTQRQPQLQLQTPGICMSGGLCMLSAGHGAAGYYVPADACRWRQAATQCGCAHAADPCR